MYVYFIATNARPALVKIGKACDIDRRLAELQTGCPYTLRILGSVKCRSDLHARGIEQKLHQMLRHSKQRSEWFHLTRQVEHVLRKLAGSQCDRVTETIINAFEEFRKQYREERRARRRPRQEMTQ